MNSTKKETAHVGTIPQTNSKTITIEYPVQVFQEVERQISEIDHITQELIRYGTAENRDLFAARYAQGVRGLRETLRDGRI